MLILISDKFDKTLPTALAKYGEVTDDKNRVAEADIILVRSKTKANKEYLDSAKNLKLIIRGGVGMDNIDVRTCRQERCHCQEYGRGIDRGGRRAGVSR